MLNIQGVSVNRYNYMHEHETHYFGFDEENEFIEKQFKLDDILINTLCLDDIEDIYLFDDFIDKMVKEIMIDTWDNYYENLDVNNRDEWSVIIHYHSGKTRIFSGINAYPSNFKDFIELCKKYDFAFYDEDYSIDDEDDLSRDRDYLAEIKGLEESLMCPECELDHVVHVTSREYVFRCSHCGHEFIYENGKQFKDIENEEKKLLK